MNIYEAIYMPENNINWAQVTKEEIACTPWEPVPHIRAWFQVCWNENGLHVRMQAQEKDIVRNLTGPLDSICDDSCLEFFFSPESDGRYLNMEVNPNGAINLGLRYDRYRYTRLTHKNFQNLLQVQPFTTEDGWGVEYMFPLSFLQLFYPGLTLNSGKEMRANFYKCGDCTPTPHYKTWNPVGTPSPDYHQPAYFGNLILK